MSTKGEGDKIKLTGFRKMEKDTLYNCEKDDEGKTLHRLQVLAMNDDLREYIGRGKEPVTLPQNF